MSVSFEVIAAFRAALASSNSAFAAELEGRGRQLLGNMVDGRVLPKGQKENLQAAIFELVRVEALPRMRERPNDALRVLDLLRAYGWTGARRRRARVMAERAARSRPPAPPIDDTAFLDELATQGLGLPPELVALYAVGDGFDLSRSAAPHVPVFALLPSVLLDVSEESEGYPRRVVTFEGGDAVELAAGLSWDTFFRAL